MSRETVSESAPDATNPTDPHHEAVERFFAARPGILDIELTDDNTTARDRPMRTGTSGARKATKNEPTQPRPMQS